MRSFKTEVLTGENDWSSNALRFATKEEAEAAGKELLSRWYVPRDSRATASEDPVNYRFDFAAYRPVRLSDDEIAKMAGVKSGH